MHNNTTPPYNTGNNSYNGYNGHRPKKIDQNHDEDEIDLKHLFYLLWGHKWIITSIVVVCTALAALAIVLKMPIYESNGSIMITSSKNSYSYAGSDLANLLTSSYGIGLGSSVSDELQILKSRSLSMQIADTLMQLRWMKNGEQYPILYRSYPDEQTVTTQDTIAARLRDRLTFNQVDRESRLIEISFKSPSPLEVADVVNFTIEEYAKYSTQQNRKSANAAVDFLDNERKRLKGKLQDASQRLESFMNKSNIIQVDEQTKALIKQSAELEMRRQEAQSELTAANAAINQYKEQLNNIKPGLAEQFSDALGPNVKNLQYKLAELKTEKTLLFSNNPQLKKEGVTSPQLQKINNQISYFEQEINHLATQLLNKNENYLSFIGEGNNIVDEISNIHQKLIELGVKQQQYKAQVSALTNKIDNIDEIFNNLPENMTDLARLKRSVTLYEQMYLNVSQQYGEMALWQQTQFGQGQRVDSAFLPEIPVEPNKKLYLLVGFVLGCIFGVGFVLVKEAFNTTIDGVNKLKEYDVPLLAAIPDLEDQKEGKEEFVNIEGRKISTQLAAYLNAMSPFAEAYRRLESNIL
ncbi:MAG TPA: Wzz/FepE/Etk N-terminal domain-containing protein, partial [Balneolaceae bacterium]|nr:Wzz/FepE/Etk N-terminal domain-containing protein [Balneolaceae bacterium]